MASTHPPIGVNVVSSDSALSGDLGNVYTVGGKAYRLVKAAADIAAAAKKVLVTAMSSGVPTWAVNTTTTANDSHVVGIVPSGIDAGTTTSGTIDSGEYFLVQVSGPATAIAAAAVADNAIVATSTTAGSIDDASATAGVGAIGTATAAATAASADITVNLKGLL